MTDVYRIRVSAQLGPVLRAAFASMRAVVMPRRTIIEGWLSAEEFDVLLRRMNRAGAQVIRIDCPGADSGDRRPDDPAPG